MPSKAKKIERDVAKLPSIPKEMVDLFLTGPMILARKIGWIAVPADRADLITATARTKTASLLASPE